MKKIKITDYVIEGEDKVNHDVIELDFNEDKWGDDRDVKNVWIKEEIQHLFGVELKSWKNAA